MVTNHAFGPSRGSIDYAEKLFLIADRDFQAKRAPILGIDPFAIAGCNPPSKDEFIPWSRLSVI